jgi:membrane peptidoglycan carboxypeptidase
MRQVAGVVLSVARGDVLGEAAWQDGRPREFSPAFLGRVQPGSTFKPFAMLSALEQGFLETLSLESSPFESSFIKGAGRAPWSVRNYGHTYRGTISLKDALVLSDNTAFARLAELLDIDALGATYARFALAPEGRVSPSIALGAHAGGISLVQLASAYAALANGGVYLPPRIVRAAAFGDGRIWWSKPALGRLVVKDGRLIASLDRALREAADTLAPFRFAGKTGTTHTGTLFAGYSRELSVVLWGEYRSEQSEHDPKTVTALQWATRFARGIFDMRKRLSI